MPTLTAVPRAARARLCVCVVQVRALEGVTVISIAHRLETLLDYDKVLVLGPGGCVLEHGAPGELAAIAGGTFAGMLHQQRGAS